MIRILCDRANLRTQALPREVGLWQKLGNELVNQDVTYENIAVVSVSVRYSSERSLFIRVGLVWQSSNITAVVAIWPLQRKL